MRPTGIIFICREQIGRFGAREEAGRGSREQTRRFGAREGPDEGLGSKSGGLAHGRRLFERYGLHYMLLGVWQAKNVSAEK